MPKRRVSTIRQLAKPVSAPCAIGAFAGATILSNLPADVAKPVVGVILLGLGLYVLYRFLALGGRRPEFKGRVRTAFLVPLGLVGGFVDATGGGGWGPVSTTSLLSAGKTRSSILISCGARLAPFDIREVRELMEDDELELEEELLLELDDDELLELLEPVSSRSDHR